MYECHFCIYFLKEKKRFRRYCISKSFLLSKNSLSSCFQSCHKEKHFTQKKGTVRNFDTIQLIENKKKQIYKRTYKQEQKIMGVVVVGISAYICIQ